MPKDQGFEIRDLRNGDWYWIHKAVIQSYVQKVGATGVLVYSFLASFTDSHQSCYPSQKYIADKLGYSRATVNKAIKRLENNGLIRVEKRSRYHCVYCLLKIRCKPRETQMSTVGNSDVKYIDTNNNKRTININNIVNQALEKLEQKKLGANAPRENMLNAKTDNSKKFQPETREELLALDLAEALEDRKSLPLYLYYAKKYPENFLRRILGAVKEIPDDKIRKSRGAFFNYLIKKHAEKTT